MSLWLTEQQAQAIARHAMAQYPAEACGFIAGKDGKALRIIPISNVAVNAVHHFEMEATSMVSAIFDIERQGLALIGIYHSHPNSDPIPSQQDIQESHYPDVCHLIVSLANSEPRFSAWRIRQYEVESVTLHIGPAAPQTVSESLSTAQKTAIILSMVVAFIFMILVSLSLLPPAPQIP